ncbi:MAG: type II secretion system minor pseudopilin GspK [Hylemonella sp.]|uniref:type II secretion system minor pseudopilin GspK n=1 Tax=Hylemonella sp. TaxID=2066020 RepID=UPI0022CA1D58|nr:type II secretion system minor pseudopilin GspK [Hylemonella sp.]MCZ8252331.1 type II secretion system minor pseudopilin GspK [Hylemonella sp.]
MKRAAPQQGAVLLTAMLTVTLVASYAAAALWQQSRGLEVEAAERARSQQAWVLVGALDWARLILREDARSGPIDHLSEPWALPLQESRLSSFLSLDSDAAEQADEVYLSGRISDLQGRMNVNNLVVGGQLSEPDLQAWRRLYAQLSLPEAELAALATNLQRVSDASQPAAATPLPPQRVGHLVWLGLSARSLAVLRPYITLLPVRTTLNLNTASAEVIQASLPPLDMTQARRLVERRSTAAFRSVPEALRETGLPADRWPVGGLGVASHYFEIQGRLRLGTATVRELSVVERQEQEVRILWRERSVSETGG